MSNKPSCTFIGRVVEIGQTQTLGKNPQKPFYKREIIVDDAEPGSKYPNEVIFEQTGDRVKYLDQYKHGDMVEIDFFPNGRAWTDPKTNKVRHFISLRIGYIKKVDTAEAFQQAEDSPGEGQPQPDAVDYSDVEEQMPF